MKERVLITGIAGFVGHHFAEDILKNTDWEIIGIDRLGISCPNGFDRLREVQVYNKNEFGRVQVFSCDLSTPIGHGLEKEIGQVDYIFHLAASSHVDRSITHPVSFTLNNVVSTLNLLEFARRQERLDRFIYFSTDEIFGTAPEGVFYKESDRMNPANPYSGSKAASECMCMAYANTFKVPIVITNSMNIIGERQHPEKFLPLVINKVLDGETVFIHGDPAAEVAGKRHYLHARSIGVAMRHIVTNTYETLDPRYYGIGKFNIVGEKEYDNLTFASMIADAAGRALKYKIVDFHSSRPGHDLRYALDGSKLKASGFDYPITIEESLKTTVRWFLKPENRKWLGR